MKEVLIIVGGITAAALAVGILFFSAALGAAFGALAGWLVAIWFPLTAAKVAMSTGYLVYQIGAILGFVGSFFRPVVTQTK